MRQPFEEKALFAVVRRYAGGLIERQKDVVIGVAKFLQTTGGHIKRRRLGALGRSGDRCGGKKGQRRRVPAALIAE
ncbi:hypothetical protein CHELA40_11135 [Chelatococcus asaccharovorans]|nr:hypothetical protein [Chelatococcus asaccharovorans]CAH1655655.1 hypothetical protein CHELA40_11135 [Chelatococcus asaccharovorans]